jgi:integrase/recombinase XerD
VRISEALKLKYSDIHQINNTVKSITVIGKGDKQRQIPLPEKFGNGLYTWRESKKGAYNHFLFEKETGSKPPTAHAVRAYLHKILNKAGINKKVTPHKMRHTYATKLLSSGAQLIDIQALLGHVNLSTTQIYSHVTEERLASVVSGL